MDWKLFIIVIASTILILYLIRPGSSGISYEALKHMFNNTSTDPDHVGGILVSNFSLSGFQAMIQSGDVSYIDTATCAGTNRKTCTAYSLLRRDLAPVLFSPPGINLSVPCGLILDVNKAWSLVTLAAIIDADTNLRSCCTNETNDPIFVRSPYRRWPQDLCAIECLSAKYGADNPWVKGDYVIYMPMIDKGGGCPLSCNGDVNCMYANSGGSINLWLVLQSQQCQDGVYKDLWDFNLVDPSQVPDVIKNDPSLAGKTPSGYLSMTASPNCATCKKPYLCVPEIAPSGPRYGVIEEDNRIATYIGADGLGFRELVSYHLDIGSISITQCRFVKQDWEVWIKVIKAWYQELLNVMRPDNSMPDYYNFMLADPVGTSYLENEVNLYIDPDPNSVEYQQQNKTWQDAIIGFYYVDTTCEEQLSPLNGIKTTAGTVTYTDSTDRCDAFWVQDDSSMNRDKRRQWEINNIAESRDVTRRVAQMFNDKHGRKVPVYKCRESSSTFPNYNKMKRALEGEIRLDEVFVPDS